MLKGLCKCWNHLCIVGVTKTNLLAVNLCDQLSLVM
jgi:hypothetical protein